MMQLTRFLSLSLTLAHGYEVASWRDKASTLSLTLSLSRLQAGQEEPEIFLTRWCFGMNGYDRNSHSRFGFQCLVGKKSI